MTRLGDRPSGRMTPIPDKWILLYRSLVMYENATIQPLSQNLPPKIHQRILSLDMRAPSECANSHFLG